MHFTSKSNRIINIRPLEVADSQKIYEYFKKVNDERTYILYQREKITLKYETNFVKNTVKKSNENKTIYLLAEYDNEVIGSCSIDKGILAQHHTADIGIIIAREFRGEGLGKFLMQQMIKEAKNKWQDLKIIQLDVFANNPIAQKLYQNLGFEVYGILPQGVYYRRRLVDKICMFKKLR
jgi:RimJ/RimL family protein N-acetyltransferase